MKIIQAFKLALKKIKFNKGKSLFVIIPIALMVAIIVLASSEAINLINVAHNSIFSPIQSQNEVIELSKNASTNPREALSNASTGYTSTDNSIISNIANVESVGLISTLPVSNIQTKDLFTDNTITISSIAGLDSKYASLYTNSDFNYTEGSAIPIILNANDFSIAYEDWQGKTEISIDFAASANPENNDALNAQSPIKTKALAYNRDDLIGKTFTISFGGLDSISDISQSSTSTGIKFTKKTQTELDTEIATRKTAIQKYWNYDQISKPLTYTFIVAGISEGSDKTKAYIPQEFATKLMSDYLQNEITARNSTAIPSADQNATYTGLVYDGVALTSDTTSSIFAGIRNQVNNQITSQIDEINKTIDSQNSAISSANAANREAMEKMRESFRASGQGPGGNPPSMPNVSFKSISSTISKLSSSSIKVSYSGMGTSYSIPGLVYNKDRTTGEVAGEYTSFTSGAEVPLTSNTILIKINSLDNRESVVSELNSKGYNFQDYSQYKQYDRLESYLYLALNIGSIVFMVITALFILINMAKFVSEGRREIGIFRAIGGTKGDIRLMFVLQSIAYILISIVSGIVIGFIAVAALANIMVTYAQQFINAAVGSAVTLSGNIAASDFSSLNFVTIGIYALALIIVTLVVSLIPSSQAANVSPVEAIRN